MVAYAYASRHPETVRRLVLSESVIPGFGLEELMNPATGGYWHFGFHMQVDLAAMLTAGKEAAYLLPMMRMMSISDDAPDMAERIFLPHYAAPGGMRAGFQHYGTLLEDGRSNQAAFRSKLDARAGVKRRKGHSAGSDARKREADFEGHRSRPYPR